MSLQKLIDSMNVQWQLERSQEQMTLGELILTLKSFNQDYKVITDQETSLGRADSYRGYYEDLSIEPSEKLIEVKDLLKTLEDVLDTTLTGYKGGDFLMSKNVPVWVAAYSRTGRKVMSAVSNDENKVVIIATEEDEF